jgi:hypothetical protein
MNFLEVELEGKFNMNADNFYDIYDYVYVPLYKTSLFFWFSCIFGILIVGVICYFVIRFFIKRKLEKEMTADFWALRELQKLNLHGLKNQDDFKKFYFDLTFIIKRYLKKRYGWSTVDKTDEELIRYLEYKKFDPNLLESLKNFMSGALWVKFAGEDALKMQAEKDLKMTYQMVQRTKNQE